MAAAKPLKNAGGSVAEMSATDVIPVANLATGTATGAKFVRDDGVLATPTPAQVGAVAATGHTANSVLISVAGTVSDLAPSVGLMALGSDAAGTLGFYRPALFESSGVLSGGALSINADPTKFNVAAAVLGFADYTGNPVQPTRVVLSYAGATAQTVPGIGTRLTTYVGVNAAGVITQQATPFTNTQRRTIAVLGLLVHSNLTIINAVNTILGPLQAGINQLHDYFEYRGPLSRGMIYSANGVNLNINRTSGSIFQFGANFQSNPLDPHVVPFTAATALTFRYRTQLGEPAGDVTAIDPNTWDDAGTLTAMTGTRWSTQRINVFQSGLTRIQYGQATYANVDDALASLQTETFNVETNIAQNGVFRGWLVVRRNATDLSDTARARFIPVSNLGNPSTPGTVLATTDDLVEGVSHLYFTNARVSSALTATPVTSAQFRQSAALSVVGNATGSTATVTDIAASTNDTLFGRVAGALGFFQVTLAMIASAVQSAAQGVESLRKIFTGTPSTISATSSAGVRVDAAAGDHSHAHGAQTDGTMHAAAIAGSTSGFMTGTQVTDLAQAKRGVPASAVQTTTATTATITAGIRKVLASTALGNTVLTMPAYNDGDEIEIVKTSTDAFTLSLARPGGLGTINGASSTLLLVDSVLSSGYIAWKYQVVAVSAAVVT